MREYSKIAPQFYTGTTGKKIRECADTQSVAVYLLAGPHANMIGLYYLPMPTLCHETGLSARYTPSKPLRSPFGDPSEPHLSPIEVAQKILQSLAKLDFAHYDPESETFWVPEMARFQIGDHLEPKDKRIAGVRNELMRYRNSPFVKDFCARYGSSYGLNVADFDKPLVRSSEAPYKTLPSQKIEQEQNQEQNQEQKTKTAVRSPSSPKPPVEDEPDYDPDQQWQSSVEKPPTFAEFVDEWNAHVSFSPINGRPGRLSNLFGSVSLDADWVADWRQAVRIIKTKPFLCGKGDRGWKITPDKFLMPTVPSDILRGVYDSWESQSKHVPSLDPIEIIKRKERIQENIK